MEKNTGCFSFLIPLKDEDFSKEIEHSFVKKYSKELSRSYILLDTQAELSWTVKIRCRETHRHYYMCEGEWSFLVKFYDLKYGDYLLFFLIDDNVFKIIPYGADCCPKFSSCRRRNHDFHQSISGDDSWNNDDEDNVDDDEEEEEEDDRVIHKRRRRVVDSRTNQNQNNNKIKVELGTGHSKRSQDFKKSNVVESCPLGSSSRSTKSGSRGSGAIKDLNAKDPFFIVTLRKHHRRLMTIPKAFAEKTKIVQGENVTLRGKDNREWIVGIENTKDGRFNMKYGWRDFYKGYDLEEGDNCKFTHLMTKDENKCSKISTLLFEVTRENFLP